jgi:thioredoxin 1
MKIVIKIILFSILISLTACNSKPKEKAKPKVTFIELGSIKCKPCIAMQDVIKQIEAKYPQTKVKTIFHDVWTKEKEHFADDYQIDAIPTQIFLDENGEEFFRHEGFFAFEDLDVIITDKLKQ